MAQPSHSYTQCAHKGCYRHPRAFSYYCPLHAPRIRRTGSPDGHLLLRSQYRAYMAEIAPLLDHLADTRPVIAALKWIDALLQGNGLTRAEWPWIKRLLDADVDPARVLLTCAGVVGATRELRLDEGHALDANIGNALVRIVAPPRRGYTASGATRYAACPPAVYRPLGRRVRSTLAPLLYRVWDLYYEVEQRDARLKLDLSAASVSTLGTREARQFAGAAETAGRRLPKPADDPVALPEPTPESRANLKRRPAPTATLADQSRKLAVRKKPKHSYTPKVPQGFDPETILRDADETAP